MAPDFRVLFERVPAPFLVVRPDFTIAAVSDAYLAATMTKREEILGRGLFEVFPDNPADLAATGVDNLRASLVRVVATGRPDAMAVQEYDVRRPESEGGGFEERHWSPVNSPVYTDDGALAFIIHHVEDVTDYVRLRQRDKERAQLNAEMRTEAGRMEKEIFQRAQELQESNRALRALQAELEQRVDSRTAELTRANAALQFEIEERRRAEESLARSEEQLRQSQKMEAIGRLAGGIAHDFNNLLSVILSYSELQLTELPPTSSARSDIEEIRRAGERAADLTRQMLAFSRQQVMEPRILDVKDTLETVGNLLRRVLGEDISLRILLAPQLGQIWADPGQLEQVLMNLVVNARDAMPNGGRLTIATSEVELDAGYAAEHPGTIAGPHVMIAVTDSGIGMDKATQARVFEPFFTTKEHGKGTGLGLSTVFGIVRQSGGHIWLYSEVGVGTTFKIYFPTATGALLDAEPPSVRTDARRGSETILLTEDEEQLRVVASEILRRAGYKVLEAANPDEALRTCREHSTTIDLLITDVIMPIMNGRQLAERISSLRPGIRVLFTSGYTDDVILNQQVLEAGVAFIQKPITPDLLMRKVRDVIDG